MNKLMLTITVATAALLGAHNTYADTVYYVPPGVTAEKPFTLGQMIAYRLNGSDTTEVRSVLEQVAIRGDAIDLQKGYTFFAIENDAFDANNAAQSIDKYLVSGRVPMTTMHGDADNATSVSGENILVSRTGNSYYVNGMRVKETIRNPEGTIYVIGGPVSAFDLF